LTAAEIAAAVRGGNTSAVAITRETLARIAAEDSRYNAFTTVTAARALAEAEAVDRTIAAGNDPGALAGVPYAVKNLFDVRGEVTLAGSKINRSRAPAAFDATTVSRMGAAGAVLVGMLNMDEYAYGFTTENAHYGPTRNPHAADRIAGGSSGGCGAAVGAGLVPIALGSDTNGSIRVPSALCGVYGLKPTFGRISRGGTFPFVYSLDHIGPFAASAGDLALAYDAMQGADARDPMCAARPPELTSERLGRGIAGLRIGLLGGYFHDNTNADAWQAVEAAAHALGVTRTIELPEVERARAAAFVITASEGGQLHLPNLKTRRADFDPLTRDRLSAGALVPANWYLQAQRLRRWFSDEVRGVFEHFDVLLAPATPTAATRIGQETMTIRGREVALRPNMGILTQPISFIGLPVAVAPVGESGGLPLGVQIIAPAWREDLCLRVASTLEGYRRVGFEASAGATVSES